MMKTSQHGQAFIAGEEWVPRLARCGWHAGVGLYFPYNDYRSYPTMGKGHLIRPGEDFSAGLTDAQVDDLFARDLAPVEHAIDEHVTVVLAQHQFDALVDFGFNEGPGALDPENCTFIRNLNRGYMSAPLDPKTGLVEWSKSRSARGGPLLTDAGLLARRRAECHLWSTPWPDDDIEADAALIDLWAVLREGYDAAHA